MKNKTYVMLLLTTTFIVGCGGDSGGSSSGQSSTNTSGQNASGSSTSGSTTSGGVGVDGGLSTGKPKFDPVALAAKATTLEQLEALPEYKQFEAWIKPYLDRISNKKLADLNTHEKKLNYLNDFREVYSAANAEEDAAKAVMVKAATQGRSLEIPTSDKSWAEMVDYIEFRSRVSDQLEAQNSKFDRFNWARQFDDVVGGLYVQDPKTQQDKDINTAIDQAYTFSPDKYMYGSLKNPIGMMDGDSDNIRKYINGRFEKDNQYPAVVKAVRDVLSVTKTPSDSRYKTEEISDDAIVKVLKEVAGGGCVRRNFFQDIYGFNLMMVINKEIKRENTGLSSVADYQFTEKLMIEEMIKSGKFGTLFQYLRGKELLGMVPFPAAEYDALVAMAPKALAADISPSTLGKAVRQGSAGVDATQLQLKGISAGKVEMALPISINLKGKIDGAKTTAGTSGSVAYKAGNTVLGVIHAYANKGEGFEVGSHQSETSVAVSQSIGHIFVEGQVGYIGTHDVHNADMTGQRYQLSVGFDAEYVSPFVQVAYRDFGIQNDTAAYVGAELNIHRLKADTYSLDMNLTAKAGVDSKTEFTGSLQWSASLDLNNGISFKTDLTLGTVEGSTFGLTANMSR